jgi:hypothetical protein
VEYDRRVRPRRAVIVVLAIAVLFTSAVAAQTRVVVPPGWIGTWKLNLAKSSYVPGPAPYKRARYTIEPTGDAMKVTYDMVHPRGGVSHFEWTGRIDGKDYPVQGFDQIVTYAYSGLNDGSYQVISRIDGRLAAISRITLSPDGRTMTTTTGGTSPSGQKVATVTVYEKEGS